MRPEMIRIPVEEGFFLKNLELRESEEILLLVDANRPYLREWLPWLDLTRDIDEMLAFVESAIRQQTSGLGFQAGIWCDNRLVGIIGYHHLEWANRSTCLGYWLAEGKQRKGIMTKASRSLVAYAFEELRLNRVEIRCAVGNLKSRAIPERLGFRTEGVLRDAEWLYDHFVDHVVYGMLARDWPSVQSTQHAGRSSAMTF